MSNAHHEQAGRGQGLLDACPLFLLLFPSAFIAPSHSVVCPLQVIKEKPECFREVSVLYTKQSNETILEKRDLGMVVTGLWEWLASSQGLAQTLLPSSHPSFGRDSNSTVTFLIQMWDGKSLTCLPWFNLPSNEPHRGASKCTSGSHFIGPCCLPGTLLYIQGFTCIVTLHLLSKPMAESNYFP